GLLAGPIGWAALGGGVLGGLAAKLHDGGFPDARLKQLGMGLTPNSSALVAVIEHRWVAEVEQQLMQRGADLATQALSDDIARQLKAGEDVVYTVVGTGDAVVAGRSTQAGDATTAGETGVPSTTDTAMAHDAGRTGAGSPQTPTAGGQASSLADTWGIDHTPPQK